MTTLAITLLGLAAWFAERGSRSARRERLGGGMLSRAGADPVAPVPVPAWVPWSIAGGALGWVFAGTVMALVGAIAGAVGWRARERSRAKARDADRDEQLVDAVTSITAALRAGQSVPQAMSFAAAESRPPLRRSMEQLEREIDTGVPIDDALTAWTREVDTDDARLLTGVLRLHRRSGGDLTTVLDQVSRTLRERRAAVREVRALTAQARLSGTILGVLPFGFFAFLWLTSRSEIEGAFRSPAGMSAIALGLVLEGAAFLWIRHLLAVR